MDNQHVVGAGFDAVHHADGATALAALGVEAREVAGAVADHGRAEAVERREDELALFAVRQGVERFGVDDLGIVMVLEDVEAGRFGFAVRTRRGDTGSGDLGEAVDVMRYDAGKLGDLAAHLVRPRFGAEDAVPELRVAAEVDAGLLGDFNDVEEVARGAGDGGRAEIAHQHELLLGVAGGGWQHRAAEVLAAVVEAEAAGEESVAVGDLEDVLVSEPVHRERARGRVRPDLDVTLRVGDADGLAGRAGRAVEADDLLERSGGQAGRILVAEVRLFHEREPREILERDEIAGLDAFFVAACPEQGDAVIFVGDDGLELLQLKGPQLVDGHEIGL